MIGSLRQLLLGAPGAGLALALGAAAVGVGCMPPAPEYAGPFVAAGLALSIGYPLFFLGETCRALAAGSRFSAVLPAVLILLLAAATWTVVASLLAGLLPLTARQAALLFGLSLATCAVLASVSFLPRAFRVVAWAGAGAAAVFLLR